MARASLNLSIRDVGKALSMSPTTIQAFEAGDSDLRRSTHQKLKEFYETQGLKFLGDEGVTSADIKYSLKPTENTSLFDQDFLDRIDNWRMSRPGNPSRQWAIKQLIEISLNNWELEN